MLHTFPDGPPLLSFQEVVDYVKALGVHVVAATADNARNVQLALQQLHRASGIIPVNCWAMQRSCCRRTWPVSGLSVTPRLVPSNRIFDNITSPGSFAWFLVILLVHVHQTVLPGGDATNRGYPYQAPWGNEMELTTSHAAQHCPEQGDHREHLVPIEERTLHR